MMSLDGDSDEMKGRDAMKKRVVIAATVLGALLIAVVAQTQPPDSHLIPYHGYVQNGGSPADGLYDFEFSIYPSADPSAAAVWSERQDSVMVVGGNFSVALGEGVTSAGSFDEVWALDRLHLGIELCERTAPASPCFLTALAGRQRILSVPSAVSSVPTGPLGQIMAIDFDAPDPDPAFWLESDGRAIPAGSRLGRHLAASSLPLVTNDLTDDRFLMGAAGRGRGGDNDGHTHAFALAADNPTPGSPLASHTHNYTRINSESEAIETENQSARRFVNGSSTIASSGPNNVDHTHPISGTVGAGTTDGDAAGSNRPRYQAVRYFVKIN